MRKALDLVALKKCLPMFIVGVALIIVFTVVNDIDNLLGWINAFFNILTPFVIGFVIAYLLNIPCLKIRGCLNKTEIGFIVKNSKIISIIITFLIFFALIFFTLSIVVPTIYTTALDFVENIPVYYAQAKAYLDTFFSSSNIDFGMSAAAVENMITPQSVQNVSTNLVDKIFASLSALLSISTYLLNAALALIASFYFLLEVENFQTFMHRFLTAFVSPKPLKVFLKYASNINSYFKTFIYCQIIDAFILGTAATIGLSLVGSQYALALGPMLGVFNIIPYFGAIIGSILAVIIIIFTDGISTGILAGIFLCIAQQIDGNVVQPKLLGGSLSLSPILIIISITVGGATFGVIGMIIAIPIVTILKDIVTDLMVYRESKKATISATE